MRSKIVAWIILSRPAFHTVGLLPFILGTYLAYRWEGVFNGQVFAWGIGAVILIMLSTYWAGEYFDREGDAISLKIHSNKFAGGTRLVPRGVISARAPFMASIVSFFLAGVIGVILQFIYKTGPWTLVLGGIGALSGFFYSTEPVRLVKRGLGEVFIAFCYGWLPVAVAFYLQTSRLDPLIHWIWLPIGSSIFNVILLNEFPDYEADRATGKKNLLYRLGYRKGLILYQVMNLFTVMTIVLSPLFGVPAKVILFFFPFVLIAGYVSIRIIQGAYREPKKLEMLCGLNIAVNLGTSISYILAYL
ncbi:MAG: prenyltransferase [Syntrophales bacterium]|nr:prenyltransferase [Syntrophales bacterium]